MSESNKNILLDIDCELSSAVRATQKQYLLGIKYLDENPQLEADKIIDVLMKKE